MYENVRMVPNRIIHQIYDQLILITYKQFNRTPPPPSPFYAMGAVLQNYRGG